MTTPAQQIDTSTSAPDVIDTLVGIAAASPLADLRALRPEAKEHSQRSYAALFAPTELIGLSTAERFAVALRVATHHAAQEAITHYRAQLEAAGAGAEIVTAAGAADGSADAGVADRLRAILRHADLLSLRPVRATADDLRALAEAGLATYEILVLSQIISFVSFQVRVVTGLQLIGPGLLGAGATSAVTPAPPVAPVVKIEARSPSPAGPPAPIVLPTEPLNSPTAFTRDVIQWTPWLVPLDMADATPEQVAALAGRSQNSAYFRLLALDATVLSERTLTDRGIFYTPGGAPRAERELAAAATSRLNGCIYCASVHARLSGQLSKREAEIDAMLDQGVESGPVAALDGRWQAIVDFAVALARTPSAATTGHVDALRRIGLSDHEILDVAQAAAFFSWANRLMLTLGEPSYPPQAGA